MVSHAFGAAMAKTTSLRLTKRIADASAAREDRYHLWDVALPGFGLRVEKSGTKTFIVRYRADGGGRSASRRFITIGRFGTLTVDQARRRAKSLLGAAAVGEDPAAERDAKRRELTVSALADLYEEEGCFIQCGVRQGRPMKPRTKAYMIARLRHHVIPLLGHKRVTEVDAGQVERFVRDVALGKTAKDQKTGPRVRIIVRGGEGAARKVVRDLSAHSLRHTMGSTAVSTGEALAMTGAILGHANARSTSIYAHVQRDPAKRAADRVSKRIAAALGERPRRNSPPSPSKSRDAAWSRATQASQGGRATGTLHERLPAGVLS
jgi:hypothetical protein